jgi:hypothetical protein
VAAELQQGLIGPVSLHREIDNLHRQPEATLELSGKGVLMGESVPHCEGAAHQQDRRPAPIVMVADAGHSRPELIEDQVDRTGVVVS